LTGAARAPILRHELVVASLCGHDIWRHRDRFDFPAAMIFPDVRWIARVIAGFIVTATLIAVAMQYPDEVSSYLLAPAIIAIIIVVMDFAIRRLRR